MKRKHSNASTKAQAKEGLVMSWDKLKDLTEVQRKGQLCLALIDEHQQAYTQFELQISTIDREIGRLDADVDAWRHNKPTAETFATHAELQKWERKATERNAERTQLTLRRRALMGALASERTTLIKLDKEYVNLQRCQRNLQAVVDGESPASGFQGGVYRVT